MVAQVALPVLLPPRSDTRDQPPNVIQPSSAAFAVWMPIFAASLGYAGSARMAPLTPEPDTLSQTRRRPRKRSFVDDYPTPVVPLDLGQTKRAQ